MRDFLKDPINYGGDVEAIKKLGIDLSYQLISPHILFRELKKFHAEYCKWLDHDPDETWEKYNLRLIEENKGVDYE